MDYAITDFMTKNFTNVETTTSSLGIYYVTEMMNYDRYTISKQQFFIITKRINESEKYVAVYHSVTEVCDLLVSIKNNDIIIANEGAKFLASMIGCDTI